MHRQLLSAPSGLTLRHRGERGDIVLGWLIKIAVVLGVAGILVFDAISVGTAALTVSDQGRYAARAAGQTWLQSNSIQQAYDSAVAAATEQNPDNVVDTKSFVVDPDGTVHLRVSRTATTLVLVRFEATRHWADVAADASGRSVS